MNTRLFGLMALASTLTLAAPAAATTTETERFTGVARDEAGQVAYVERHRLLKRDGRLVRATTTYYSGKGERIAKLDSDYRESDYAPTYRFDDYRHGYLEAAKPLGDKVLLLAEGKRERIDAPDRSDPPLALGQGLHRFAQANLATLARGKELKATFAIPSRFDSFVFRVRAVGKPKADVIRLRIEVDSWLLRLLAPELEVDYDLRTARLLRYRGVSNVSDAEGEAQKVVITYRYPERKVAAR